MSNLIDLTGKHYGNWIVLKRVGNNKHGNTMWLCRCSCPKQTEHIVGGYDLTHEKSKSCGCRRKAISSKISIKHGLRNTKLYGVWANMKTRCYNQNNQDYQDYGARGITVCPEWLDKEKGFINFYNDVSKLPHFEKKGYSLNRIDNNGNYELSNVEWSTDEEQANNKRNNILITYNGKPKTLKQWANKYKINYTTLYNRLFKYDWSIEKALNTPVK